MQKKDYLSLTWRAAEVVEHWISIKLSQDETMGVWDSLSYEEWIDKYLHDNCKDPYVVRTRWKVTSSKLKAFIRNPEEYRIRYELELPEFEPQDKQHFKMWHAFDVMVSSGLDEFNKKYYVDKWFVKWDLAEKISLRDWIDTKILWKMPLEELRNIYYKPWDKIRLTPAEARDVMWMYREYVRQPLFDREWEYQWQQYIEAKFWPLTISWTLDRFSLEKQLIRDTKTAGRIERFERDVEDTFDYVTQMAFYFVLVYVKYWNIECDVRLDIVWSSTPYWSIVYKMSKAKLKKKMMDEIKPALIALARCQETWERPLWDRMASLKSPYYQIMQTSIMHQPIE